MHYETEFDRKRLRKNIEECYVESKLEDKEQHVNIVVTKTGLSVSSRTEPAVMLLSKKKIICK